ncbi:MAG: TonB-dependent receptor plug domain-containing protein [Saprospiraceae bacterium]|nr:TonB-dependent receptor plug domain-containing protein [Saprospiraceae bacterium]
MTNRTPWLLVAWLLLCSIVSYAQAPCYFYAKVVDSQTFEPLIGASFRLDGKETQVTTDLNGQVRMPVTCAEHTIRFTVVGYKPFAQRMLVEGDSLIQIEMENIATQLEEVVVTAQSAVRTMETPALGVSVLSMKAVQKIAPAAGEVDVLRGLQTLPGVSSVGEGANGINIRGGAVEQNLILIDNMPVFNPTHLLGLFSLFPTDAIREMQLYKGSIPARYGGRTAAVLDVRMSEASSQQFSMKGGVGIISNRLHANVPIVKDKLAWLTSSRFSFNEYLVNFYNEVLTGILPFFDTRMPNNKPKFFDLANKITWTPTIKDHISFSSYISYDSYRVDTLFNIANIIPRQATMRYGHNNMALRWNHYFSDKLNMNALGVRSRYNTTTAARDNKTSFDYDTRLDYYNGKVELTYAPSPLQRINMGATVTRYDINPADLEPLEGSSVSTVRLPSEQAWEIALFASDEYEINDKILAEIGFRYVNYWNIGPAAVPIFNTEEPKTLSSITDTLYLSKNATESHYARFEPRLALRYKIDELSSVKIGYNRMNQFLQMIANNATPLPNVRWKNSNRYVPPAQSDLVSAGYFRDSESKMWEWSVEGYYRWQRSIFDYLNGAELNVNPVVETQLLKGIAKAYGVEFFINKKKGVMTGWLSYTYARSFQQITGDFPALQQLNDGKWFQSNIDKPHTVNVLLNFQREEHNAASFTFVYSTGRPYTAPVSFFKDEFSFSPVYTDRNNARISDYHRLDFSWTINNPSMKDRRWESSWVFTVYNVYGRKNAFSYFFNPDLATFRPYKVSVFPTPLISITYNFKFE